MTALIFDPTTFPFLPRLFGSKSGDRRTSSPSGRQATFRSKDFENSGILRLAERGKFQNGLSTKGYLVNCFFRGRIRAGKNAVREICGESLQNLPASFGTSEERGAKSSELISRA